MLQDARGGLGSFVTQLLPPRDHPVNTGEDVATWQSDQDPRSTMQGLSSQKVTVPKLDFRTFELITRVLYAVQLHHYYGNPPANQYQS